MNPLRDRFEAVKGEASSRAAAVAEFGFAVPTDEALEHIQRWSPNGVVEIGAGVGYWAHLLQQRGTDVLAYDVEPPPSPNNTWHAGQSPWHRVERGGIERAVEHADRTLLLGWPTQNEVWPADALEAYASNGGSVLAYVGEPAGGRTGDDRFHAMLGALEGCMACTYGLANVPCTCGVKTQWIPAEEVELPCWEGFCDRLVMYRRADMNEPTRPGRWRFWHGQGTGARMQ